MSFTDNVAIQTVAVWVPVEDLIPTDGPQIIHRFLLHWRSMRGIQIIPQARQFDPIDVPWALNQIFLIDVLEEDDFTYRLTSENHNRRYGRNLKGLRARDFLDEAATREVIKSMRTARDTPAALFVYATHTTSKGIRVVGQRVVLPLGDENHKPCQFIGVTEFSETLDMHQSLIGDQQIHVMRFADLKSG